METGRRLKRICEPSKGGTGIKLNIAKRTLMKTIPANIEARAGDWPAMSGKNRKIKPKNKAINKFEPGPAKETFKSPHFWSLKLKGLTGTGLAQPKRKGLLVITNSKGTRMEPIGSMWLMGFSVRRPAFLAVVSPS